MTMTNNDAPGIGHNLPAADDVAGAMAIAHDDLESRASALLAEARALPADVTSDEDLGLYANMVKKLRDAVASNEAVRVKEKEPYLRGGQAVDGWFKALEARLATAKSVLEGRAHKWQLFKLERERQARRAEAERLAAEAEAARLAAERARKVERIAEKTAIANATEAHAAAAVEATQASSADMVRERFDSGAITTMKRVPHVEIADYDAVPLDVLKPYLQREAVLRAVKAWARQTEHKQQLPGCVIELRDSTVIV